MKGFTIGLVILLCWLLTVWRRRQRANKQEEWDIREATFLYQARGLSDNPCYLEATCTPRPMAPRLQLALSDEFMGRMSEKARNFHRSSDCEATADGMVNKTTGQTGGYLFTVEDIFWISATDVEVSGGLSVGTTAGISKTYYLQKAEGKWQIVGEHLKSIECA